MLEVQGQDFFSFWNGRNMDCFVALIEKNLEIILTRFLNDNYTSLSLEYDWEIWDFRPKYNIGFMLKVFNIADFIFRKVQFHDMCKCISI